jgi:hypothetical protein
MSESDWRIRYPLETGLFGKIFHAHSLLGTIRLLSPLNDDPGWYLADSWPRASDTAQLWQMSLDPGEVKTKLRLKPNGMGSTFPYGLPVAPDHHP